GTVSSRPSRARTLPKVLVRPWTSTAGMSYMASSKGSAGSGAVSGWGGDVLEVAVEHGAIGQQPLGVELQGRQRDRLGVGAEGGTEVLGGDRLQAQMDQQGADPQVHQIPRPGGGIPARVHPA